MTLARDGVGIAVVLASAAAAFASHRALRTGKNALAAFLLVVAALLMRAFPASDLYLHAWDERYHALVAKHLAQQPAQPTLYEDAVLPYDFRDWARDHVWLHKQPLALWTMALSLRTFGVSELAMRLPSVLLSSAAVAITFFLGLRLAGPRVAWVAGLLHVMNGFLIDVTSGRVPTDHVDAQFLPWTEAAVALTWLAPGVRGALLAGVVSGLATLAKSPLALVGIPAAWPLWRQSMTTGAAWRRAAGILLVAAIVFLPWQLWIRSRWPDEAAWEARGAWLHFTQAIEGHQGGPWFHLVRIPRYFGEASILSLLWFARRVAKRRAAADVALALWIALPYVIFSAAATKMPGYVFVAAPAIFLVVAMHFDALVSFARTSAGVRRFGAVALATLLVALPLRYGLERMKPVGGPPWRAQWAEDLRRIAPAQEKAVLFGTPHPIEAMFATSLIAYERLPEEADILACRSRGYAVMVLDDGHLPERLLTRSDVRVVAVPAPDASR